jgi:hypothetical protein
LCRIAVDKRGSALGDVPEALKTEDLCLAAVRQSASVNKLHLDTALSYVTEALREQVKRAAGIE